ncbi:MAG: redoxin domain-containing protein [Acidobacteria bacterium]|nr:redoxin domain-containing protein [Acidobacteriota bacterium]
MRLLAIWALLALSAAPFAAQSPSLAGRMKDLAFGRRRAEALQLIEESRPEGWQRDPAFLEALSWMARGASFAQDWETAEKYAHQCYEASLGLALDGGADSSPALATALGASVEVLGQALAGRGERAAAIDFLGREREAWAGTSIETRIQKNYLLLGLEGRPMPSFEIERYIGAEQPVDAAGQVALFYFWAHWCADCKAQKPSLLRLHERYAAQGLRIIGPTRLYGYYGDRTQVPPAEEIAYIEGPWQAEHPLPDWMPKPLTNQGFVDFGVSTTPTLVLVDRQGVVSLYHPGQMSYEELEKAIRPLL